MSDNMPLVNKPRDTAFHQQRLRSWRPVLTARNAYPIFILIGIIFLPLGISFIVVSNRVSEKVIEYTHCKSLKDGVYIRCAQEVRNPDFYSKYNTCLCSIEFQLVDDIQGPVYFYYGLSNFYQNHRRYVASKDDTQLHGLVDELNENCEPYRYDSNGTRFAPCGAIAMSLFNDSFTLYYHGTLNKAVLVKIPVTMNGKGIAWKTDVERKFGRPPQDSWANTVKPHSWPKSALERSADAYSGDEDLLVWMRPAAFPTFRKLYRMVSFQGDGLPAGNYSVDIHYAYPVTQFGGTKRIIISGMSFLGGRNPTLGIAYTVTGGISLMLGLGLLILCRHLPLKLLH